MPLKSIASFRSRVLTSALLVILVLALAGVAPAAWAQTTTLSAAPSLVSIEKTAGGYALLGRDFGNDPRQVQVIEGTRTLDPSTVTSVTNERIVVRSRPSGMIAHKVVVSGQPSNVLRFTHVAEATLATVTVNPAALAGGRPATGTVTLTGPAPKEGASILLATPGASAVSLPDQITIPAGQTRATFEITTKPVAAAVTVLVAARYGTSTQTTQLVVSPPVTLVALTFRSTSIQGGSVATGTATLSGPAPDGGLTVSLNSGSPDATVPATVTIPAGSTSAQFQVQTRETAAIVLADISANAVGSSPQTTQLTIQPPVISVSGLSVNPSSVQGGQSAVAVVTLSHPAPAGGMAVNLSSNHPQAQVIPSLSVAPGATTAEISIRTNTTGTSSAVEAMLSAVVGSTPARSTKLTIRPIQVNVSGVSLTSPAVQSGTSATGTVTLSAGAPEGGARVAISSSSAKAVVPATLTIQAGATSAPFTIQAGSVNDPVNVTITAQGNDADRKTASLTINPLPVSVSAVTVNPSSVVGGAPATATVTLSSPAPAAGAAVTLSSSAQQATVPATVTVPAGSTSAQFTIQTGFPAAVTTATLSAGVGSTPPKTAQLTISVAPPTSGTGTAEGVAGAVTMAVPPPSVHSIVMSNPPFFVKGGMFVKFSNVTPDREARITAISGQGCNFVEGQNQLPFGVQTTPDGQPPVGGPAVVGTITRSGNPPTSDVQCSFTVTFEWRPVGGTWQEARDTRSITVRGHESVTVSNTASLQDWLDPVGDIGLGDCLNGIKSHNGKLAFEVKATPLGADCPYAVLSTRNHDRYAERNFNVLPEGVMLWNVKWRVETHGSGCCLGVSKNQSCAPLPTPPSIYTFDNAGSDMHPNTVRHSVFTNKENMMTEAGIIIGWNPEKVWRSAVMEMYGRLSCPAVNPVTEVVTVKDSMCDAGCSALSALGLAAVVPSGTGIQGGQLAFVDGWHGECQISGGPLGGQCKAATVCPPGQEKFDENGVWKCRSTTLTQTDMPWVRVVLDSITVLRPPGTALPW